jgi:23S rRNA (guanine745-N1)-methyltransferase
MIGARAEFLGAGHYAPLGDALAEMSAEHARASRLVIEAGAGTGYYISRVLDALPEAYGLAIDLSKYAARRAARVHARLDAVVADLREPLSLKNGSAGLILNVFAPRPAAELRRVLASDGSLLVASPTYEHMLEIREPLGLLDVDPRKDARMAYALGPYFGLRNERRVEWKMLLDRASVRALVLMGPSARHLKPNHLEKRMESLTFPVSVTASVNLRVY